MFAELTQYHRKHAIRVLNRRDSKRIPVVTRSRLYDEVVRQALVLLWEASDRLCGKGLKALIPMVIDAMHRHDHIDLDPAVRTKLPSMSAATIDRALRPTREQIDGRRKRRTGIGAAIRRSIPVRAFADWNDPPAGYFEVDMVEHCGGPKTDGNYVHSLVMTDIASGWTECVAMPTRNQLLVVQAMSKVAIEAPFAMLGVDTDNDGAFMNQLVFDYCKELDIDPVALLQQIRAAQRVLADHAKGARGEPDPSPPVPEVALFMKSLSEAWKAGEVRPTHRKAPGDKRWWRSRADPFAHVWTVVDQWLETEPSATASEMLERLAAIVPDVYAGKVQLRTLQRRVKQWREDKAKALILGYLNRSGDNREGTASAVPSLSIPAETTI